MGHDGGAAVTICEAAKPFVRPRLALQINNIL
jgi:hypothetical protein